MTNGAGVACIARSDLMLAICTLLSVQMTLSMADPEDVPGGFENEPYDEEVAQEAVVKY